MDIVIQNPVRHNTEDFRNTLWYDYYAGYSPQFVMNVVDGFGLEKDAIIMDPWNGSGTTTHVVQQMGYSGIGLDINPAMIIVAKSRLIGFEVAGTLQSLGEDIITKAKCFRLNVSCDPLGAWLTEDSISIIRKIDHAIQQLLIDGSYSYLYKKDLNKVSSLALFFYVALFRAIRELLNSFRSSNPTWIRRPKNDRDKKSFEEDVIFGSFLQHVEKMNDIIISLKEIPENRLSRNPCKIELASSEAIPLDNNTVDAVVTSPPYCTRIDYAIATLPELAIIGFPLDKELKKFRDKIIGSPTITNTFPSINSEWGKTCVGFLESVKEHGSKASCSYYYKNFVQYFNSIYNSLIEINRTLRRSGRCVIVVQDSYYKDIHLDLGKIIIEMACSLPWKLGSKVDFTKTQHFARINKRAVRNKTPAAALESVVFFDKP